MTVYFAPPGEPLDGDNWQELGMLESDGYEFEDSDRVATVEITPIIPQLKTGHTESYSFTPSKELVINMLGFDIYALRATVAEWVNRPAPMPSIPKAELTEMQDGVNRMLFYIQQASERYATPHLLKGN